MQPATALPPDDYRITAPGEIAAYLQALLTEQVRIELSSPLGHSLHGLLVAVDPTAGVLGFELGHDAPGHSQALVAGDEITAVAFLGAIKLQFELESAVLVSGGDGVVLRAALPQRVYRFQRRQAFRVQPAGTVFPRVLLPAPDADTAPRALRVLDLSISGLALALPAGFDPLPCGQIARHLSLELDRGTALRVDLLPHHASPIAGAAGDATGTRQLGCAFADPDAATSRALQVYVDQTQKRRRLLRLDT